jgi:hypothetical protein
MMRYLFSVRVKQRATLKKAMATPSIGRRESVEVIGRSGDVLIERSCLRGIVTQTCQVLALYLFDWMRKRQLSASRGWHDLSTMYGSIILERKAVRGRHFHDRTPWILTDTSYAARVVIWQRSVAYQWPKAQPPADPEIRSSCARPSNSRPAKGRRDRIQATTSEGNS